MMFLSIHAGPKLKCWSTHISIYTTRLYAVWRLLPPLDNCAHESSLTKIEYYRIWLWYYITYGYIWSLVHSARCMCTYICWIYRYQVQVERKHWTFIRFVRLPTEELAFFCSSPRIQEDVLTGKSRAEFDKEFARWETLQWGFEWEMCITSFGYDEMMEIFPKTWWIKWCQSERHEEVFRIHLWCLCCAWFLWTCASGRDLHLTLSLNPPGYLSSKPPRSNWFFETIPMNPNTTFWRVVLYFEISTVKGLQSSPMNRDSAFSNLPKCVDCCNKMLSLFQQIHTLMISSQTWGF